MSYSFASFNQSLQKALDHLRDDLRSLRTGRASAQLLDPVRVDAYGTSMKLAEVASVTAPDPSLLVVSPWDKSLLASVEKAIASAGLNFNPVVDGAIIRISVPPLTQERRQELIKALHQKVEVTRVVVRTIRTDTKQAIEDQKGEEGISEDDIERDLKELDNLLQKALHQLEELQAQKEQELTTV